MVGSVSHWFVAVFIWQYLWPEGRRAIPLLKEFREVWFCTGPIGNSELVQTTSNILLHLSRTSFSILHLIYLIRKRLRAWPGYSTAMDGAAPFLSVGKVSIHTFSCPFSLPEDVQVQCKPIKKVIWAKCRSGNKQNLINLVSWRYLYKPTSKFYLRE